MKGLDGEFLERPLDGSWFNAGRLKGLQSNEGSVRIRGADPRPAHEIEEGEAR
ncbi:hypothetical protein [Streptomyces cupreus]|uniref:Uncharacterized protein n=1 Tax=Streptomyces cupreus TaxID=2759956 RepID=A0A7X1JBY5_9ACTN|nr:hypothetical protein [Streptomyces cupreus]MBC2907875.1 hypothetical protein [Streptomyces cupreus]